MWACGEGAGTHAVSSCMRCAVPPHACGGGRRAGLTAHSTCAHMDVAARAERGVLRRAMRCAGLRWHVLCAPATRGIRVPRAGRAF